MPDRDQEHIWPAPRPSNADRLRAYREIQRSAAGLKQTPARRLTHAALAPIIKIIDRTGARQPSQRKLSQSLVDDKQLEALDEITRAIGGYLTSDGTGPAETLDAITHILDEAER